MKKRFITKATSVLLVSQFLLSTAPLTAMAEGNLNSTAGIEKTSKTDVSLPRLPTSPVSISDESKSTEGDIISKSNNQVDDYSTEEDKKESDSSSLNKQEEFEAPVEEIKENEQPSATNNTEEVNENPSSEQIIDPSEKIVEESELMDARVIVTVTNDAELRAALSNVSVTRIQVANDITVTSLVRWGGSRKIIEGNNHTLTFANGVSMQGLSTNQGLTLSNLKIISNVLNTIVQTTQFSILVENVTTTNTFVSSSQTFIYYSIEGGILDVVGNNEINGGAFLRAHRIEMTVYDDANLKINNDKQSPAITNSGHFQGGGNFNLKPGSTIDITQTNRASSPAFTAGFGNINIEEGATLKIFSNEFDTSNGAVTASRVNVSNDGTLDILSRSTSATLTTLFPEADVTFQEGSNIRIQNNHHTGPAIGASGNGIIGRYNIYSSKGLQTWTRGADFEGDPTFNYPDFIQGSFNLAGATINQVTSNIASNDYKFIATFNSSAISKIATGNFTNPSEIAQTTINALDSSSTTVSGTGESNASITILNGSNVIASGRVGDDGNYNFTIQPQLAGATITARVEASGLISEANTVVTQAQQDLELPDLRAMFVDDSFVSGTVGGTAQFVAVYVNGVRQRTAAVNADRSFSIYTGDYNLLAGQTIQVAAVTRSSATGPVIDEGPRASVRIQDRFVAPVINPVHNDDNTVTGTIGGTARFVSVYIGGQLVQTAAVNANRTYSIDVSNHNLVAGQTLQVAGVTRDGGTGPIIVEGPQTSTTILNRDQLVAPVVNPVFVGEAFVRGTVGGTARFVAIYGNNGQFLRTAAVAADRSFEIYVGDHNLAAGHTIQVSAVTRENNNGPIVAEGPRTSERVQDRFVAPVVNPVHVGDAFVNGTIGGTAQFVGLYINGVLSRTAAVNSNRTYTIYVGDRNLVAGQNIQIAGVTRDGSAGPVVATGPMTTRTVLNSGQIVTPPTINSYTEGEQFVTGTADRNGTHVGVYINGVIRRAAAINPDGTYSIYVGDLNLVAGDKFEIATIIRTATGLITETGPKREATVLAKAMIIDRYVLRQDTITGTISSGTSRVFLEVDGVLIRRGQVEANGEFAVWASDAITSVDQKVEIVVVGANGVEIGRSLVTVHAN